MLCATWRRRNREMLVRPLRADDIGVLLGVLGRAYQTDQVFEGRLHAYLHQRAIATFVADLDGLPVGMVVGNHYGTVGYVAQMAVDPVVQRRGIGTRLMDALVAWADASKFAATELDATAAGAPLYRRYSFVEVDRTDVYANGTTPTNASSARRYVASDRTAVLAADRRAIGADRSEVIGALIDADPAAVLVAGAAGRVDSYAIAQRPQRMLGPVIAAHAGAAAQLIDAARLLLPTDHRLIVPESNSAIAGIVADRGYHALRSLSHMVRGTRPAADRQQLFARINLGQG